MMRLALAGQAIDLKADTLGGAKREHVSWGGNNLEEGLGWEESIWL